MEWGIKFRPIKPASPHWNGKVERSQRTDLDEFYATVDLKTPCLHDMLAEWQQYYNWDRPHSALGGKAPIDRVTELAHQNTALGRGFGEIRPIKRTYPGTKLSRRIGVTKIEMMSVNHTLHAVSLHFMYYS